MAGELVLPPPPTNPGERERLSYTRMREVFVARFGPDPRGWAFVCPSCGRVQSAREVERFGQVALEHLGRVCVGAYTGEAPGCGWTALTPAGGPLSVVRSTVYGTHLQPSMAIAAAPGVRR